MLTERSTRNNAEVIRYNYLKTSCQKQILKGVKMPYKIVHEGNYWFVVNKDSGKRRKHDSLIKAQKQMRLLQGIDHGWKPK